MVAAAFLEAFQAGHARFLAAVAAKPPLASEPTCARYFDLISRVASDDVLFAEMRSRIPCFCLALV